MSNHPDGSPCILPASPVPTFNADSATPIKIETRTPPKTAGIRKSLAKAAAWLCALVKAIGWALAAGASGLAYLTLLEPYRHAVPEVSLPYIDTTDEFHAFVFSVSNTTNVPFFNVAVVCVPEFATTSRVTGVGNVHALGKIPVLGPGVSLPWRCSSGTSGIVFARVVVQLEYTIDPPLLGVWSDKRTWSFQRRRAEDGVRWVRS